LPPGAHRRRERLAASGFSLIQQNSDKLIRLLKHHGLGLLRPTFRARQRPTYLKEISMKKTLTAFVAVAAVAGTLAAVATDADAQRRRWGWGPAVGLGVVGGLAVGAFLATRPRGYVVYEGYNQPVRGPGCYWASQPVYNRYGQIVGYTGQPVMVCPGY
jgi:hypothetical protein